MLMVAAGGGLGALLRYGVLLALPPGEAWPWATVVVNVCGCLVMGALVMVLTVHRAEHGALRLFLGTGLLGGFTTVSTYAADTHGLLADSARPGLAAAYLLFTPLTCLLAVTVGALGARTVLPERSG